MELEATSLEDITRTLETQTEASAIQDAAAALAALLERPHERIDIPELHEHITTLAQEDIPTRQAKAEYAGILHYTSALLALDKYHEEHEPVWAERAADAFALCVKHTWDPALKSKAHKHMLDLTEHMEGGCWPELRYHALMHVGHHQDVRKARNDCYLLATKLAEREYEKGGEIKWLYYAFDSKAAETSTQKTIESAAMDHEKAAKLAKKIYDKNKDPDMLYERFHHHLRAADLWRGVDHLNAGHSYKRAGHAAVALAKLNRSYHFRVHAISCFSRAIEELNLTGDPLPEVVERLQERITQVRSHL